MSEQRDRYLAIRVQSTGETFALGRTPLTIGRRPDNAVVLPDPLVSRQHARIEWQSNGAVIHDLGSTHGTYVNGRRVAGPKLLGSGNVLRVGNTVLEVEITEQPAGGPLPQPRRLRERPRAPGWLLVAGVALSLVAALALLLAASGLHRTDSGDADMVLPADSQDEGDAVLPSLSPTASQSALAQAETALPTAPATAAATPSPLLPTAEPSPALPTAEPSIAPPPTAAPTPVPTPTPAYPAPSLVAPTDDQARGVSGQVTFSWSYPRALGAGEGFQVLIWKEGQEHNGAAGLTRETQQVIDLDAVLPSRGGGGDYFWTVVVRRDAPGEPLLSPEADPRRLVYSPREPLPNKCASFTCDGCNSWNSEEPLCTQCQCP